MPQIAWCFYRPASRGLPGGAQPRSPLVDPTPMFAATSAAFWATARGRAPLLGNDSETSGFLPTYIECTRTYR
jgi:hypothetical protein